MALVFLATMTVAGGALLASKVIKSKPGGARLFIQRKNIQLSHKFGLLDDLQAANAYDELRRHYSKLIPAKPLVLGEGSEVKERKTFYTGPFKSEMTQYEARLVLGVTEAEAKDAKLITKKWRTMMLKNHPDTGGSPFMAAKINEAKEIVMGEKTAKEGGEDDEEDGSSGLDDIDETEEEKIKRKEKERRDQESEFDFTSKSPTPPNPDQGSMKDHPAPPYYKWERIKMPEPISQTAPRTQFFLKEDIFHRKARRSRPNWKAYDDPNIWPMESWKVGYLENLKKEQEERQQFEKNKITWVEDPVPPGTRADPGTRPGHWETADGTPTDPQVTEFDHHDLAREVRDLNATRDTIHRINHHEAVERVRKMAEMQARERYSAQRRTQQRKSQQSPPL
jgi:hypothetical protein